MTILSDMHSGEATNTRKRPLGTTRRGEPQRIKIPAKTHLTHAAIIAALAAITIVAGYLLGVRG